MKKPILIHRRLWNSVLMLMCRLAPPGSRIKDWSGEGVYTGSRRDAIGRIGVNEVGLHLSRTLAAHIRSRPAVTEGPGAPDSQSTP
jgi:hypothetical protein